MATCIRSNVKIQTAASETGHSDLRKVAIFGKMLNFIIAVCSKNGAAFSNYV